MRLRILAIFLAALMLVPVGLAAAPDERAERRQNHTDDRAAASSERANLTAEKSEAREARQVMKARFHEIRLSWNDGKHDIRERCHADDTARENLTQEERAELSHCMRDGYKGLYTQILAQLAAYRSELTALRASKLAAADSS